MVPTSAQLGCTALAALACAACATDDRIRQDLTLEFALYAGPRNAGATGAALMAALGDATVLRYQVSGAPPSVARPVQLFTFLYAGTCAQHGEPPLYALNDTVQVGVFSNNSRTGPFTMSKTVPVPVGTLTSAAHALVVRSSAADGSVDLFCGDLPRL
jgi:hypothetical protein